jgi:hypothetical protein
MCQVICPSPGQIPPRVESKLATTPGSVLIGTERKPLLLSGSAASRGPILPAEGGRAELAMRTTGTGGAITSAITALVGTP